MRSVVADIAPAPVSSERLTPAYDSGSTLTPEAFPQVAVISVVLGLIIGLLVAAVAYLRRKGRR